MSTNKFVSPRKRPAFAVESDVGDQNANVFNGFQHRVGAILMPARETARIAERV
jgi:hypothetical protein